MSEDLQNTVQQQRVFPTKEERARKSRQHAREILLEAGYDPATIEKSVDDFLAKPLLFEVPSFGHLKGSNAGG